jgi:hypothetical protein
MPTGARPTPRGPFPNETRRTSLAPLSTCCPTLVCSARGHSGHGPRGLPARQALALHAGAHARQRHPRHRLLAAAPRGRAGGPRRDLACPEAGASGRETGPAQQGGLGWRARARRGQPRLWLHHGQGQISCKIPEQTRHCCGWHAPWRPGPQAPRASPSKVVIFCSNFDPP